MSYNVILFDADHTLFDFDASEKQAFLNMLKDIQRENDFAHLLPIYITYNQKTWEDLEKGYITQSQLKIERFKRFIEASQIQEDPKFLAQQFTHHLANASILFDHAFKIVKQLSKTYRLAIVTNGLKEVQSKRIRQSVLSPYIETTIISEDIGIVKPDPRIIDYTLKQLHHPSKDDVIIIGDRLSSDIQCGFNAGIDTIWYNPSLKPNTLDQNPTYTIHHLLELLTIL